MRKFIGLILSTAFVIAVTSCASGVEEANSNTDNVTDEVIEVTSYESGVEEANSNTDDITDNTDDITDEVIETEEVNGLLYELDGIEFRYLGAKEDVGPKFSLINNSDKYIRAFIEYESIDDIMIYNGGYYLDAESGETDTTIFVYFTPDELNDIGLNEYNKMTFTVRYRDITDANNPTDIGRSDYITLNYGDKTEFDISSDGKEIFNSNEVEIYYTGYNGQYGEDISYKYTYFDVINRSDKTICIDTDWLSYSGVEVSSLDTIFIAPGCKAKYNISTYKTIEEEAGVKDTSKLEVIFRIRDWLSESKDEICKSDLIEINRE